MASFFIDGDKRRIYEVPTNFNLNTDANGYRIYTPIGIGESVVVLDVQRDLWSRFVDYQVQSPWTTIAVSRTGGALRGVDQLGNPVYQTNDFQLKTSQQWRIVLANYAHELNLVGNLFADSATPLFDYDRITSPGAYVRLSGADSLQTYQVATGSGLSAEQSSQLEATATRLTDLTEDDAGVFRFTINALEQAPAGGGGGTADWTTAEKEQIRHRIGIDGTAIAPSTATPSLSTFDPVTQSVDVGQISGDPVAADNLELFFDGTGYNAANSTIGTVTTNADMRGTDGANTLAPLTASGIRNAIGLATANLDSQLQDIDATVGSRQPQGAVEVSGYSVGQSPADLVDLTGLSTHSAADVLAAFESRLNAVDAAIAVIPTTPLLAGDYIAPDNAAAAAAAAAAASADSKLTATRLGHIDSLADPTVFHAPVDTNIAAILAIISDTRDRQGFNPALPLTINDVTREASLPDGRKTTETVNGAERTLTAS